MTSGPAGKQDQSRADYANSIDSSDGFLYTTRIIDYEGQEQFCTTPTKKNHADVHHAERGAEHGAAGTTT